ncbi:MAG: peptidoglycan DD-metalloendopeptidase family protein [Deltaproteobacteria bacterium]|nr:peptidoglycan DD-metalloendopeptidase family protein [Deltaproteobacteria bacterium]
MIDRLDKLPLPLFSAPDAPSREEQALRQACAQFEGLIFQMILKGMRRTVSKGDLTSGGFGEEIWQDFHDRALSDEVGQAGSLGLGELLYHQLAARGLGHQTTANASGKTNQTIEAYLKVVRPLDHPETEGLEMPVEGRLSSPFGLRQHPIKGDIRMHNGIDIAAPEGSPIRAATGGKVVFSGWREGYGRLIEIDHGGGLVTRYGHNQENLVQLGEVVQPGQIIGRVGQSGLSTGPHLHFEVRRDGQPLDPVALLNEAGIRRARTEPESDKS